MVETVEEYKKRIPTHIAIIMDGNGRWATTRNLNRVEGHKKGAKTVELVIKECQRVGVKFLTLYCFSTENWRRPEEEISGLMSLFREYLKNSVEEILKNNVRLKVIGDTSRLPLDIQEYLEEDIKKTSKNTGLTLVLAINYGAREELLTAVARAIGKPELVTPLVIDKFSELLLTKDIPDPDILIRTGGEMRISNFLLWQIAYTELIFRKEFWPDFDEKCFNECLVEYASRERRFGMTSQQVRSLNSGS